jgi:chromosome segregation ATPase
LARGLNILATDPSRSLTQHIQQGHSDLASVKAANHEGNTGRVSATIKKFEETAAKAQQEAQRVSQLEKNPERKKHIEAAAAKLQQSAQTLSATNPGDKDNVAHNVSKAEDALNDLAQAAKGDDKLDALDTRAKIRGLVAAMKAAQASGDLNGLLDAATELSKLLRSLIGDTTSLAKSFTVSLLDDFIRYNLIDFFVRAML